MFFIICVSCNSLVLDDDIHWTGEKDFNKKDCKDIVNIGREKQYGEIKEIFVGNRSSVCPDEGIIIRYEDRVVGEAYIIITELWINSRDLTLRTLTGMKRQVEQEKDEQAIARYNQAIKKIEKDPKWKEVKIVQEMGRICRLKDDKDIVFFQGDNVSYEEAMNIINAIDQNEINYNENQLFAKEILFVVQ